MCQVTGVDGGDEETMFDGIVREAEKMPLKCRETLFDEFLRIFQFLSEKVLVKKLSRMEQDRPYSITGRMSHSLVHFELDSIVECLHHLMRLLSPLKGNDLILITVTLEDWNVFIGCTQDSRILLVNGQPAGQCKDSSKCCRVSETGMNGESASLRESTE